MKLCGILKDAEAHLNDLENELEECTANGADDRVLDEIQKAMRDVKCEIAGLEVRLANNV